MFLYLSSFVKELFKELLFILGNLSLEKFRVVESFFFFANAAEVDLA